MLSSLAAVVQIYRRFHQSSARCFGGGEALIVEEHQAGAGVSGRPLIHSMQQPPSCVHLHDVEVLAYSHLDFTLKLLQKRRCQANTVALFSNGRRKRAR